MNMKKNCLDKLREKTEYNHKEDLDVCELISLTIMQSDLHSLQKIHEMDIDSSGIICHILTLVSGRTNQCAFETPAKDIII